MSRRHLANRSRLAGLINRATGHRGPLPNLFEIAKAGAQQLPHANREHMRKLGREALEGAIAGTGDFVTHWAQLVDWINLAQELSRQGIASDAQSVSWINAGHDALGALQTRYDGAPMLLSDQERLALRDALWIFSTQLGHCSAREFECAHRRVLERLKQAIAGNAKGREVVSLTADTQP